MSGKRGELSFALMSWLAMAGVMPLQAQAQQGQQPQLPVPALEQVLSRVHVCSDSLSLRSQALEPAQEQAICVELAGVEQRFHRLFGTAGRPVADDHNRSLRANIYRSADAFQQYAGAHFNMPTDNGGMYLEGLPGRPGNQAEFVANQNADGTVRNLAHEFVHYLDGRFNLYGDFCANLHDSHAPPENCARPAPLTPYLVWWTEGVAEYLAKGDKHPKALELAAAPGGFKLSELFDTGYEHNGGTQRVYTWGYLAARYMLEQQRPRVDQMLGLTRSGDYPRYQALVRQWGVSMDEDFARWLQSLQSMKP